jgi:hypothetical protein
MNIVEMSNEGINVIERNVFEWTEVGCNLVELKQMESNESVVNENGCIDWDEVSWDFDS